MTRVLVTGAAGFMGSHVVDRCLAQGYEVVAVDDLSGGFLENVSVDADFREGSVQDVDFVRSLWGSEHFDYVYHLAAYAAEGLSHFIRRFNYDNNLIGSINLINQSILRGVECFVFTSSIAVYGHGQTPMREDMDPRPDDPYGISKLAVELDLAAAQRMFGLDYVVFRPHNVYGERQNIADKYRNVIGIFMNQLMHGQPLTIFGDGTQTRAFSHIDDVAPLIAKSAVQPEARNTTFNVGADTPCSVNELAERVSWAFDMEPNVRHLPARNEVVHAFASHDLARRLIGYQPRVELDEGIARMAAWARTQGPRPSTAFADIEIPRGLPEGWS